MKFVIELTPLLDALPEGNHESRMKLIVNAIAEATLNLAMHGSVHTDMVLDDGSKVSDLIGTKLKQNFPCGCPELYSIVKHGDGYAFMYGACDHRHGYNLCSFMSFDVARMNVVMARLNGKLQPVDTQWNEAKLGPAPEDL